MEFQHIGVNFLQGFGVLALSIAMTEFVWRNTKEGHRQDICTAVIFGFGIAGTMLLPFELQEGFVFDLRHVFLVISGVFAGIPGIVVTVAVSLTLRIQEGGAGMQAGIIGIGISAGIGLLYTFAVKRRDLNFRILIFMGVTASLGLFSLAVLPKEVALYVLRLVGPSMVAVHLLGVLVAGYQLVIVNRNITRERDLEFESKIDPLTGLLNRRAFEAKARSIADDAVLSKTSYGIFVLDIDNFKSVNDTFGHTSGDKVIQSIAKILTNNLPTFGKLGRFGGEEYVMLVPRVDHARAIEIAEQMRVSVQKCTHKINGLEIAVTISAGFSLVSEGEDTWENAFELADQALYQAKQGGRNKVVSSAKLIEERFRKALGDAEDTGSGTDRDEIKAEYKEAS